MERESATEATKRRRLLVRSIVDSRQTGRRLRLEAADTVIKYENRRIQLELTDDERARLDELREEYHVFKIEQPATRKADDDVVYLSAVTDPKHAADFLEALFVVVYGADESYELRAEMKA